MNGRKLASHVLAACSIALLASACSGSRSSKNETPAVTVPPASAASPPPPSPATPAESAEKAKTKPAPEKPNRCLAAGPFPALPEAPKPVDLLPCRPAEKKAEKDIADAIRKKFAPEHDGSKIEVKYGCDGLDKAITKIVLESGGGHGTMSIVRIERADPAAPTYEVTGIRTPGVIRGKPPIFYELLKTLVSADAVALKMPFVRAALRAKIVEVGGNQNMGRGFGTSSDTHLVVRLEDAAGRVLEGRYTGGVASVGQEKRVPLEAAMDQLQGIVTAPQWQSNAPITDDVRQFFEQRFVAQANQFGDEWAWWVRERYVEVAAHLGTKALVPLLLHVLKDPSKTPSTERTRAYAVEALAALTGWEPRAPTPGTGEKPHSIEEAANDFLEQCGKVPMAPAQP